jgi:hypothetical protein
MKQFIIITGFLVGLLSSCNDDFMQQDPSQELTKGAFFKNESDLPLYLNQLYDLYITGHQRGNATDEVAPLAYKGSSIIMPDYGTDNAVAFTGRTGNPSDRLDGSFIVPDKGTSTGWEWDKLRAVNYFLQHYSNVAGTISDPSRLNRWKAEACFFKAWDYYTKLYIFGEVPWYVTDLNVNSPELFAPRTSRVELVDSILATINFAIEHLPEGGAAHGRINRQMANFLKARICLFEGTFRKYHTELKLQNTANRFLEECVTAANAIMTGKRYELYNTGNDPYWKLFQFNQNPAADGNKEAILARVYDGEKLGHGTTRYYTMGRGNAGGRYSKGATKGLIDDYLCIDGRPIYTAGSAGAYTLNPLFKGYDGDDWRELDNRDPRLTQTVVKPGEYITAYSRETGLIDKTVNGIKYPEITYQCPTSNQVPVAGPTVTGYLFIKHWTNDIRDNGTTTMSRQTAVIFRYAEVLLMYAEAKAELETITDADLDNTINRLRERAGFNFTTYPNSKLSLKNIPDDPRLDGIYADKLAYSVSPLIREIRRERRIEMVLEGLRREDLVRWKAGRLMEVPLRGVKFTSEKQLLYNGKQTGKPVNAPKAVLNVDVFIDSEGFVIAYPKAPRITQGTLEWKDMYYYWPIPFDQLKLNKRLTQSPIWEDIAR